MTKTMNIPIADIDLNVGQIPGLPDNPRIITPEAVQRTVDSIVQDPQLLELRRLMVYALGDKYVVIDGNARLKALRQLNYKDAPCVVIPPDTPIEAIKRYIAKTNASFGQWDFEKLTASWDIEDLESWAIDVPPFEQPQEKKRPGWNSGKDAKESLCDLKETITLHIKGDISFVSFYKKSEAGFPLSQIKGDIQNVKVFADMATQIIKKAIGLHSTDGWCIITTPKRRHKEQNFASMTAAMIADRLGIPFHDDVISAKTRQRVNPTFTLEKPFEEKNVIVFDDIITTGSTLTATNACLPDKNCFFVVGINNN